MRVVGGLEIAGGKQGEIGAFVAEISPGGVVDTHGEVQEGLLVLRCALFCDALIAQSKQEIKFSNGTALDLAGNHSKRSKASFPPPEAKLKSLFAGWFLWRAKQWYVYTHSLLT